MISIDELRTIISSVLQIGDRLDNLAVDAPLLGGVPEFDSMAVVAILTAIEDGYGITIEDDEVSAEHFETIGNLHEFVNAQLG